MAEQWDLLFTFPNLSVPVPTPFAYEGYVICSGNDPRLNKLASNAGNATARKMLKRFRTARGESYRPACFLVRTDIPVAERDVEAIRAFRNICSISATTPAYAQGLRASANAQWFTHWSDQFLLGYFIAGQSGWVQTLNGATMGSDDEIPRQQPSAQFGKPSNWSLSVDEPLLDRLFRSWRMCYFKERKRRKLLRLFRSLEVAFHASLFPADGLTSINDIGTRLALWVSAFEVLCHPGGSVNKRIVQRVIAGAPFSSKKLTTKRYAISFANQKIRATLPEALYDDLYWARCQFLHGMPVQATTLRYRQSKAYARLTDVAPVLFNAAVVSFLNSAGIPGAPIDFDKVTTKNIARQMKSRKGIDRVQKGLIAAGKP